MQELSVLLVGGGVMGRNHLRVLTRLGGVKVDAVVDPQTGVEDYGDLHDVAASIDDLDLRNFDLAIVATPTATHEEVALQLLKSGIHLLVEKPLAHNFEAAERLSSLAIDYDLVGAVGHIERFNPAIVELKARLDEGIIGTVYQVCTIRRGAFPSRIRDVGVARDLATHDTDITSWLTGLGYDRIHGEVLSVAGSRHEDFLVASGRLRGEVIFSHVVNWMSPIKERKIFVYGSEGLLMADTVQANLTLYESKIWPDMWENYQNFRGIAEGNITNFAFPRKEALEQELTGFVNAVTSNGVDFVSFAEGAEAVRVSEAMIASSKYGHVVTL